MLVIRKNLAFMKCVELRDEAECIEELVDAFFLSVDFVTPIYPILAAYPKLIIQHTTEHRIKLYNEKGLIKLQYQNIFELENLLSKYSDDYYIVADIIRYLEHEEMDLYHLNDFIYKYKIDPYLRPMIIDEILKDME